MSYTEKDLKEDLDNKSYEFGFVTDIESEKAPIGLNEDIIKLISSKKNEPEWLLNYRLEALKYGKKWKNQIGLMLNMKNLIFKTFLIMQLQKRRKSLKV
jgi:hypothetical protein